MMKEELTTSVHSRHYVCPTIMFSYCMLMIILNYRIIEKGFSHMLTSPVNRLGNQLITKTDCDNIEGHLRTVACLYFKEEYCI